MENQKNGRNQSGGGQKQETYDADSKLLIFLLHYKRKLTALDIDFFLETEEETIQKIINKIEKEIVVTLEGEIIMKTKE